MTEPRDDPLRPDSASGGLVDLTPSIITPSETHSQITPTESAPFRTIKTSSTGSQSKQCWICFATEEDDENAVWVKPCNCKGTTKWVHHQCLQLWIDEKQKGERDRKVVCPQCRTEYLIFYPRSNYLVILLDKIDALIFKMCPFIAAGVIIGSMYWTAVTYGTVTIIQVAGQEEAIPWMDGVEPAVLLTTLPAIPLTLIALKASKWEESFLQFIRSTSPALPLLNYLLPAPVTSESGAAVENRVTSEGVSCTRIFTGALLLPTIATLCGNRFFQNISSPLQRALVGGLTFITVRGLVKMYHKHQMYKRLSKRRVLDYTEENIRRANSLTNATRPTQGRTHPAPVPSLDNIPTPQAT